MPTVRPVPTSYYYSGQGRLGIGDRNPSTGEWKNVVFVGNVTSLSIDIEITKFEHKESMSGERAVDLTIIQERKANFKFTSESLTLDLLALGLYGSRSSVTGAAVLNEAHLARRGFGIPLKFPDVSALSIMTVVTPTALVEGVDYHVDFEFGMVYIRSTSTVVDADPGEMVEVDYTYATHDKIESFTTGTPPERFLRFEGLNTIDGTFRLIEIPRAAFDPLTGMEFINEELGSGEFGGTMLPDPLVTNPALSKYFTERRIAA